MEDTCPNISMTFNDDFLDGDKLTKSFALLSLLVYAAVNHALLGNIRIYDLYIFKQVIALNK